MEKKPKAKIDIAYKKGAFVTLDYISRSYTSDKVDSVKIEAIKKRLRKKFESYIGYAKHFPELIEQEGIFDHYYANPVDISQWLEEVKLNYNYSDESYWESARQEEQLKKINNREKAVNNSKIVEIPFDKELETLESVYDKKEKLVKYRLDKINWEINVFKKSDYETYAYKHDCVVINKKTGKIKLGKNEKKTVLDKMRAYAIKCSTVNKDLTLAILNKEYERLGFDPNQTKLF